jgi:hypothetical protein
VISIAAPQGAVESDRVRRPKSDALIQTFSFFLFILILLRSLAQPSLPV